MAEQKDLVDFSQYIEDIDDEYEFEDEPVVPPAKPEPPRKRPVSPVVTFHRKTIRNSYMLVVAGLIAAVFGAFNVVNGGLNVALSVFISALGLIALAIGMASVQKTKKTIDKAQRDFARDRAMRIYLKCVENGITSSETDEDKARILKIATERGFDDRKEAVGLYDAGRKLTAQGLKPDPELDSLR